MAAHFLLSLAYAASSGGVVISGAGPAGLLAAHAILSCRPDARVTVFDRRPDPRTASSVGARAYSLGINVRGRTALQHFGLWEAVAQRGVLSSKFFLHFGSRALQLRANQPGSVPTLLISRDALAAALLDELQARHAPERLQLRLGTAIQNVDLRLHQCTTAFGEVIGYTDLIGADGVNSAVRGAMHEQADGFAASVCDLPGRYKVFVQPCPPGLDPLAVHAMGAKGYSLFSIPKRGNELCTLLAWRDDEPFAGRADHEIAAAIATDVPKYGAPTLAALAQLRAQQPSKATTVRCSRYHDPRGRALLLGDAAHSTGGTLGQGANSALLDVLALDALLRRGAPAGESVVEAVGEAFSAAQQPEGLALWQLLQLPPRGPLRLPYTVAQAARGLAASLTRALPQPLRVRPPVQALLSESTTPFAQIVALNRAWVDAALRGAPAERHGSGSILPFASPQPNGPPAAAAAAPTGTRKTG